MTFRKALTEASEKLKEAGILFCDSPFLDASVLLSHASGLSREKLLASFPDMIDTELLDEFRRLISMRLSGLPVSYIRRKKEFFGRDFYVDSRALVPRPDTETLIEWSLELIGPAPEKRPFTVLDLCTGSGCIGITLKLERPGITVLAADISPEALEVASINAMKHSCDINFIQSSLFSNISGTFDLIVTNPPYLTSAELRELTGRGWPEPEISLEGGKDGLDLIRKIVPASLDYLKNNSYLLIEAGPGQAETVKDLMKRQSYSDVFIRKDLAGRDRITGGKKSGR
jgi:release factor glutamine methyltransferase